MIYINYYFCLDIISTKISTSTSNKISVSVPVYQ